MAPDGTSNCPPVVLEDVKVTTVLDTLPVDKNVDKTSSSREQSPLWYLAYGSNLNSAVFLKRRGIKPLDKTNVLVQGLELTFDLPGVPYLEPRFANCRITTGSSDYNMKADAGNQWDPHQGKLIGVAYLVTPSDFAQIVSTEGGGASYQVVTISGDAVSDLDSASERTIEKLHTLLCNRRRGESKGWSSARYMGLIRDGARENELPAKYQEYLARLPAFQPSKLALRQRIGQLVFVALWAPVLIVPLMVLGPILRQLRKLFNWGDNEEGDDGRDPTWLLNLKVRLFGLIWQSHDNVFEPIFGSGERSP